MYYKIQDWLAELICYHNDWGMFDFVRRILVTILGEISEFLRNHEIW